jgi:hypothetical protein
MGTGYWHEVKERIVNPRSWAETSDRENAVRGRPDREHFRLADAWLRAAYAEATASTADPSEVADLMEATAAARARLLAERRGLGLED